MHAGTHTYVSVDAHMHPIIMEIENGLCIVKLKGDTVLLSSGYYADGLFQMH